MGDRVRTQRGKKEGIVRDLVVTDEKKPRKRALVRFADEAEPYEQFHDIDQLTKVDATAAAPSREQAIANALRSAAAAIEQAAGPNESGRIEDFGKKIEGARKDYAQRYADTLAEDVDVAAEPLSKSWPEPDYQKLLDEGADPFAVAFVHAARDEVPTKPSKSWRLKEWVEKVKQLRDFSAKLLAKSISTETLFEYLDKAPTLEDVRNRATLYTVVGHEKSLKGVRIRAGQYSMLDGVTYNPPKVIWTIEGAAKKTAMSRWPTTYASGATRGEAIENFKRMWASPQAERAEKAVAFEIYGRRNDRTFFIGKKIGANVIELKGGFATAKEARTWKAEHQAELDQLLTRFKDVPSERRTTNDPRVGADHRDGADVTPEQFAEAFGFRGGQFGNTMPQTERQVHLNETYDALMDLAGVLGIPPKALSLNGELGLAFGARGHGGRNAPAAHYEPDTTGAVSDDRVVINLTRKRGAGSLAHEWFHAVDNYFARMRGDKGGMFTFDPRERGEGVRPEMAKAFRALMLALYETKIRERSKRLDRTRTSPYWSTADEMGARAFESYVIARLQDQGASNDYLANIVSEDVWNAMAALGLEKEETYPYPTPAEVPTVRAGFDQFFATVQTKETAAGVAMYSRAGEEPVALRRADPEALALGVQEVRNWLAAARERLSARVDVYPDHETARRETGIKIPDDAAGFMHRGRIGVIATMISNRAGAENTLWHEALHAGLHRKFGRFSRAYEVAVMRVAAANAKVRDLARAWRAQFGDDYAAGLRERGMAEADIEATVRLASFEEALAEISGELRGRSISLVKDVIAALERLLRAMGFTERADWLESKTDAEALSLIRRTLKTVERRDAATPANSDLAPAFARGRDVREQLRNMDPVDVAAPDVFSAASVDDAKAAAWRVYNPLRKQTVTATDKRVIQFARGGFNKTTFHGADRRVIAVLTRLPELFERALPLFDTAPSEEDGANIRGYHYYGVKARFPSGEAYVSLLVREEGNGEYYYDADATSVTEIETGSATPGSFPAPKQEVAEGSKPAKGRLAEWWNSVNDEPDEPTPFQRRGGGAAALAAAPTNVWDSPEPSKIDNIIYALQDKHVDTKRVIQAINDFAGQVRDALDVYLQEELFHGRTAKRVQDFVKQELKPLLTEMTMRGVKSAADIADFEKYLHARHAEERNLEMQRRNPTAAELPVRVQELEDQIDDLRNNNRPREARQLEAVLAAVRRQPPFQGDNTALSGMRTQDARAFITGLDPQKRRAYDALAARVDAINRQTRHELVTYGLESQETIDEWGDQYQFYVPLYREGYEDEAPGIGQGFSVRGPATKRATGSTRDVVDILANIAMQRERAIVRGEKNAVATALVGLAKANPNPDFWRVDIPPKISYIDEQSGMVRGTVDPLHKSRDNAIVARIPDAAGDVVEHVVTFNKADPRAKRMATALKNLDLDDLGTVLSISARVTRYFASVNTQYNPIFGIVNLLRDTQGAMFNLTSTPIAGKQAEVLKNMVSALKGIYIDLRDTRAGAAPTSTWAQLWEEFQRAGGQTGYRDLYRTSKDRGEAIERELARISEGKTKQIGRALFDWLSDYNLAMENAARLAAYKVAKESGLSNERAASLAKNLTVNFNRKGQVTTQAAALYAFFNASVQGTARLAETLTGPAGKKIIAGGVALGVMQAIALAAAGFDDDEPPDFVRERNLVIPIGGKKYLTIPMPLGLHILPALGRVPTEYVLSGFRNPGKRVAQLANTLIDAFNPMGSAGFSLQTIAPTALDPLVALAENKDWTGKPIARKDFGMNVTPGHTRAKDTASAFSKVVAKGLNYLSGGTAYKPGIFSPTPDQIDYLIGQATGGVGREYMKLEQTITSSVSGEDLPTHKIPLVGRFYGTTEEASAQATKFYENLRELNEHEAEIKGRRKAGEPIADYVRANPEALLVQAANKAERDVAALRRRRRALMDKDAPTESIRVIEKQIEMRMRGLNDAVKRVREKRAA